MGIDPDLVLRVHLNKDEVIKALIEFLMEKEEIIFAYLHGSFLEGEFYRDIDVAVYVDPEKVKDFLSYELKLAVELELLLKYPVDVRVLNDAPPAFRYRVLHGKLLFTRDEEKWLEFYDLTVREYLDFRHFEREMRRELLHRGS
ncbi:nucleotidyltransferase domain-containing protein [Thermococcus sp. 9N3]|uniref:type VII toxin-antitoxin system MntA family adenylyltransferase antitoxin n=1 Tax=Thermococcus sp. 9N3 TaxID=163002 RepID=UPI003211CC9A